MTTIGEGGSFGELALIYEHPELLQLRYVVPKPLPGSWCGCFYLTFTPQFVDPVLNPTMDQSGPNLPLAGNSVLTPSVFPGLQCL